MTEMLTLMLVLSSVVWFVIDRIKPLWASLSWGKYVTIAVSAILGTLVVFTYGIDIFVAMAVTGQISAVG